MQQSAQCHSCGRVAGRQLALCLLAELEADDTKVRYTPNVSPVEEEPLMPTLFDSAKDDFIREVASVDVNTLTPIEAMSKLFELAKKAKEI